MSGYPSYIVETLSDDFDPTTYIPPQQPIFIMGSALILTLLIVFFKFRQFTSRFRPHVFQFYMEKHKVTDEILKELEIDWERNRQGGVFDLDEDQNRKKGKRGVGGGGDRGDRGGVKGKHVGSGDSADKFNNVQLSDEGQRICDRLFFRKIDESQLLNPKHLASGGFADVFTCDWADSKVAVKKMKPTLPPGELENFLVETDLISKLHHNNLISLVGVGFKPYYIVMPFMRNGSLHELLHDQRRPIRWKHTRQFSLDIAKGLWYMHTMKPPITHRDIKSGNVLIDKDWTLKLSDFGLSKPEDTQDPKRSDPVVGTPHWTAPEVLDKKKYLCSADVYSYAIVMWEILTRKVPYQGKAVMWVINNVLDNNLRPDIPETLPDHVIEEYVTLMTECWDKDQAVRPSIQDVVRRLEAMKVDE